VLCFLEIFGNVSKTGVVLRHQIGVTTSEGRQSAFTSCDPFLGAQNGPRFGGTVYQGANHLRTIMSPNGSSSPLFARTLCPAMLGGARRCWAVPGGRWRQQWYFLGAPCLRHRGEYTVMNDT